MNERTLLENLTKWRRDLHRIPEAGFCEHNTRAYLVNILETLRPDSLQTLAVTGIKCVFNGQNEARAVAFRADMDALCIRENSGVDFLSRNEGFMHACGHDGHMAMALATAHSAAELRDAGSLPATVVLLFQPGEESVGGGLRMVEEGALDNPHVDYIFGCHMMPDKPIGVVSTCPGPMMASTTELDIEFTGRSAHGAMPHLGGDAIAALTAFYTAAQTAISRRIDPTRMALFTVGKVAAGDRRNIIAETAKLEGIMRALDNETALALRAVIEDALAASGAAFGVAAGLTAPAHYPAVVNDAFCANEIASLAGESFVAQKPLTIAEDFSEYLLRRPGAYFFVGCGDAAHTSPIHSACFNFDEAALLAGAKLQRKILDRFTRLAGGN